MHYLPISAIPPYTPPIYPIPIGLPPKTPPYPTYILHTHTPIYPHIPLIYLQPPIYPQSPYIPPIPLYTPYPTYIPPNPLYTYKMSKMGVYITLKIRCPPKTYPQND